MSLTDAFELTLNWRYHQEIIAQTSSLLPNHCINKWTSSDISNTSISVTQTPCFTANYPRANDAARLFLLNKVWNFTSCFISIYSLEVSSEQSKWNFQFPLILNAASLCIRKKQLPQSVAAFRLKCSAPFEMEQNTNNFFLHKQNPKIRFYIAWSPWVGI